VAHRHHRGEGVSTRRPLLLALSITTLFLVVEVVAAALSGSLALLSDAAHSVSDIAAIALSAVAAWMAGLPQTARRPFGFMRMESVAAMFNSLGLLVIVAMIVWQAAMRIASPPEVRGGLVVATAFASLGANALAARLLLGGARENLNTRGAFLHVLGDALASVAAIVAGMLVLLLGWHVADPLLSLAVAAILSVGAVRLLRQSLHVLLEGTPAGIDSKALLDAMRGLRHVRDVHDLHIWTIASGYHAMSAHVQVSDCSKSEVQDLLQDVRRLAKDGFGIEHVTVQVESDDGECSEAHTPDAARRRGG